MTSLKLIGQTVFKLESGNHTRTDGQTDRRTDGRRTHQSNRRIGYMQPAQKLYHWFHQNYSICQQVAGDL